MSFRVILLLFSLLVVPITSRPTRSGARGRVGGLDIGRSCYAFGSKERVYTWRSEQHVSAKVSISAVRPIVRWIKVRRAARSHLGAQ